MTTVLDLHDVEVEYRRRGRPPVRAVAGVDLVVQRGQIVGLVGESGCGKSSLAKAVVGLEPLSGGSVLVDGRPLKFRRYGARPLEERRVQMVFQNPYGSLNPRRKVGDQVGDGVRAAHPRLSRVDVQARVALRLEQVGMPAEAADRFPHQYSGGQRQRIAIARALAAEPSVIVLDEPLSSLDASVQAQVCNLLRELASSLDVGMLLISHDLALVEHIADVVAVMYLGKIVEFGPASTIWTEPAHPYTRALIAAIPKVDSLGIPPEALPGEVPDPANPPTGCRFQPRCPLAFGRCSEPPETFEVGPDHRAACWLATPGAEREI